MEFNKIHAVSLPAKAVVHGYRFASYDGHHAPQAPASAAQDVQGVFEEDAAAGEAVSVVTSYSYPVECAEPIALYDYVRPAADGSGRAAVGTLTDHCGRALGSAAEGRLVEVQIVRHVHA